MVDMKFIARMCGVSVSTVSRVINKSKPVNPDTEKKIIEAIKKYDYRPNQMAKGLIMRRTSLVGILIPELGDYFHQQTVGFMEQYFQEHNYHLLVNSTDGGNMQKIERMMKLMQERYVEAVFVAQYLDEEQVNYIKSITEVPTVFVKNSARNCMGDYFHTCVDEEALGYDAGKYLIGLGHMKLGCITTDEPFIKERLTGFQKAAAEFGAVLDERYVLEIQKNDNVTWKIKTMYIPESENRPTAWFCVSELYAIVFIMKLMAEGVRIPHDVSVIAGTDERMAQQMIPGLTAVAQPVEEQACRVVDSVMSAITRAKYSCKNWDPFVKHIIVERESCRKL